MSFLYDWYYNNASNLGFNVGPYTGGFFKSAPVSASSGADVAGVDTVAGVSRPVSNVAPSGNGGTSNVDLNSIGNFVAELRSALESEFASSAAQVEAQKGLIDYSNSETERLNNISRLWQEAQAKTAYERNSYEAQLTRDWQEKMSNTAYQRVVKDLQQAGLNPILAYTKGSASTPSGASGTAQMASVGAMSSASGTASKANASGAWTADQQLLLTTINSASNIFNGILRLLY